MGGETTPQKKARKSGEAAVATQQAGREQILSDPIFQAIQQLTAGIVQNPLTFGPEQRAALLAQTSGQAHQAANTFLDEALARQTVGPGTRSGSTVAQQAEIGARLGEALAQAGRQVELVGAQQDRADTLQGIGSGQNIINLLNQLNQQVANAQLGQGSLIAQTSGQQSPASALGGGLLGGVGNILTAGTSPAGVFK